MKFEVVVMFNRVRWNSPRFSRIKTNVRVVLEDGVYDELVDKSLKHLARGAIDEVKMLYNLECKMSGVWHAS